MEQAQVCTANTVAEAAGHVQFLPFSCQGLDFQYQKEEACTFDADIFDVVMINLIKNPNLLSTQVYRADIFYDSQNDQDGIDYLNGDREEASVLQQSLKSEMKPHRLSLLQSSSGVTTRVTRTIVRQFVPRNPLVDRRLLQSCHLLESSGDGYESISVVYLPHLDEDTEAMPFYHPPVKALCFHWSNGSRRRHSGASPSPCDQDIAPSTNRISIYAAPLAKTPVEELGDRFQRILHHLITTIIKHGLQDSQPGGYVKRVNHDVVIPRKRYQDTLVRLKLKYAKSLLADWREVTDPKKHVFEDICIASFLVELWAEMYGVDVKTSTQGFPGFVDIGCGNGVLVNILIREGYEGCGFDIRRRKSWDAFEEAVQEQLHESVFIPAIYSNGNEACQSQKQQFVQPGNFIISNHADELTAWTPLIAYIYRCPFISIPCCSHDLGGQRCRFSQRSKTEKASWTAQDAGQTPSPQELETAVSTKTLNDDPGPSSGSLARPPVRADHRPPSAYATLCDYVEHLAREVGFLAEREVLRIPSTRNTAIIGRRGPAVDRDTSQEKMSSMGKRLDRVSTIVESELKMGLSSAAKAWIDRAQSLMKGKPPTH